jgi:hypothetical protein
VRPLPPERYRAIAVAAGRLHTCAILDDQRVKCWGDNGYGQLGLGDTIPRWKPEDMGDALPTVDLGTGRTAKAITAGRYTTCALLDDDSVKCWGVALRDPSDTPPPADKALVGDGPGEMGDALPRLDLGPGRTARLVSLGYFSGCVVRDDEWARCWGAATPDMPPDARHGRIARLYGELGVLALFDDGALSPLGAGRADLPQPHAGGSPGPVVVVAGSRIQDCVVWANGDSRCDSELAPWWPEALAGAVGAAGVLEEEAYTCGVLRDGHVACPRATTGEPWNDDGGPSGPLVRLGQPALAITSGAMAHFCALLQDGEIKCWAPTRGTYDPSTTLAGSVATATDWPSVDLGTRPQP